MHEVTCSHGQFELPVLRLGQLLEFCEPDGLDVSSTMRNDGYAVRGSARVLPIVAIRKPLFDLFEKPGPDTLQNRVDAN